MDHERTKFQLEVLLPKRNHYAVPPQIKEKLEPWSYESLFHSVNQEYDALVQASRRPQTLSADIPGSV